jgi:hypothetical protein
VTTPDTGRARWQPAHVSDMPAAAVVPAATSTATRRPVPPQLP